MNKYEDWITRYDEIPLEELPWEPGRAKDVVVRLMEGGRVSRGSRILDIGCGAGSNTVYMAECGHRVVGLDIVPRAVTYSKERAASVGQEISLLLASAVELPFCGSVFDLIVDIGCFHSLPAEDRTGFISGIRRTLKEGGLYQLTCFSDQGTPPEVASSFSDKEISSLFSKGFFIVNTEDYEAESNCGDRHLFYTFLMERVR